MRKERKKRLKKTSLALLIAMVLAGRSVTVYAAESFSWTMMPTINTTKDSDPYTKSISTDYVYVRITGASHNSGKITFQVFRSDGEAVTAAKTIPISDRNSHKLEFTDNYGSKSFKMFLRVKYLADPDCPPYVYVMISWNPNG